MTKSFITTYPPREGEPVGTKKKKKKGRRREEVQKVKYNLLAFFLLHHSYTHFWNAPHSWKLGQMKKHVPTEKN